MSLESDLLDDDYDVFESALRRAVRSGPSGERKLLDALAVVRDDEVAAGLVAALGEADGPEGVAALREIFTRPEDPLGLRTNAVLALAKRQGPAASDVLFACLGDADEDVRSMAMIAFASTGDDRGRAEVLERLRGVLDGRPSPAPYEMDDRTLVIHSDVLPAVCYLARHAAVSWERQEPVVRLLRSHWDRLFAAEQRWLSVHWPACDPAQPEVFGELNPTWFADWVSAPMLDALYLEGADL
ncbi:HEAT repeat domain-containing protein [Symbioplanes lichenis]|uniref:HEAT repeat domain-containing protein n=1 Tax=Symbioplanes lichenis TaxID=1629072 RepID=UPI002739FF58|nr:HEAT repeat domain-containing protein [Actinoplanes lichenis]